MQFLEEYKKGNSLWKENIDGIHIRSDLLVSKRVLNILDDVSDKKILDLGCANGKVSRWVAKKGADVTGIDSAENLIKLAKKVEEDRE